jgi:hypothetical protein
MVGPGYRVSGRTVISRLYPAVEFPNDNIPNMSTHDTFKIVCDLHHVSSGLPLGRLASFDNRQHPPFAEDFHRE